MKNMNFRTIFFLTVALACASAAHAQVGVYGMVSAQRVDGFTCRDPQKCASTDGTERPYGGTVGLYYDFRNIGPVRFGADLRGNFLNANKSAEQYASGPDLLRYYSGLGGARATFKTPFKMVRPYAEGLAGYTRVTRPLNTNTYTQVQGLAGIDLDLFPNVDFRLIEFGYGRLIGSDGHGIQSIGLGIVFHTSR